MAVDIAQEALKRGRVISEFTPPIVRGSQVESDYAKIGARQVAGYQDLQHMVSAIGGAMATIAGSIGGGEGGDAASTQEGYAAGLGSVTRDQGGNPVVGPAPQALFGKQANAYSNAVFSGMSAKYEQMTRQDINEARAKIVANGGGPEEFDTFLNTYKGNLRSGIGSSPIGERLMFEADKFGQEHLSDMRLKAANDQIGASKINIESRIDTTVRDMSSLARQGKMDSLEYNEKKTSLAADYAALKANPLFGYPEDLVKDRVRQKETQFLGEAAVGQAERNYQTLGATGARRELYTQVDKMPGLTSADRVTILERGEAQIRRMGMLDQDAKIANKADFEATLKRRDSGIPIPPEKFDDIINEAKRTNDIEMLGRAMPERFRYRMSPTALGMTPGQGDAAQGIPRVTLDYSAPSGRGVEGGGWLQQYMDTVGKIESRGNPNAVSPTGYRGLYQFGPSEWRAYGEKHGSIYDPNAQRAAMREYTMNHYQEMTAGLGRQPTPSELYLAHQQGAAGAIALVTHPDQPAGSLVPAKNISVNGGDPRAPAAEFVQHWTNRFDAESGGQRALAYAGTPSEHPYRYQVEFKIGNETFNAATGGRRAGSVPPGDYTITGFQTGQQRAAAGFGYTRDAFTIADPYDPGLGRYRRGILIHEANSNTVSEAVSSGCFAVPSSEWPRLEAALISRLSELGGRALLRVGVNGEAKILPVGAERRSEAQPTGGKREYAALETGNINDPQEVLDQEFQMQNDIKNERIKEPRSRGPSHDLLQRSNRFRVAKARDGDNNV